jgi:hypothetical protein
VCTRNPPGDKELPAREADSLTASFLLIVEYVVGGGGLITTQWAVISITELALLSYVDDVRTSQEAYASTACYGDSFTFYI